MMFNLVKRRDLMLGHDVPTQQEAEKLRDQYGKDYMVVQIPGETQPSNRSAKPHRRHSMCGWD
jgi:hypothetical protein